MNNENLHSEIQARFKRVDNELSIKRKINKGFMIGASSVAFLGAAAWLTGKLPTPNFNFLMGAVLCSCMAYEYHLAKKDRRILSAEFPKGVVDEHTR